MNFLYELTIDIDALAKSKDLNITISRIEFKDICRDLFDKSISLIEKVLKYSNLTKDDIDEIIWSTRIPKIEEIIK